MAFTFMKKYNATVKVMLKLPLSTKHDLVNNFLGPFNFENMVIKNYYLSGKKW